MSTKFTRLPSGEPLIPSLTTLRRIRSGSKISRFFRYVFQHSNIKRILGSQLALMLVASSFIPNVATKSIRASEVEIKEDLALIKTERSISLPLTSVEINQYYHFFHPGVDFEGLTGDPVYSVSSGTVVEVGYSRIGYGNSIYIEHDNSLSTLYAHLSKINVKIGDRVKGGEKIGEVGSTGRSTGDHLHLEVKYEGNYVNPLSVLPSE